MRKNRLFYLLPLLFFSLPFINGMISPTDSGLVITRIYPDNNQRDILIDSTVQITFDRKLIPDEINELTFRINDGEKDLAGKVISYPELAKYIFEPTTKLLPSTRYTVTIAPGIMAWDGNILEKGKKWSFTTRGPVKKDSIRPFVIGVYPEPDSRDQAIDASISIAFSKPISKQYHNDKHFSIKGPRGFVKIALEWDDEKNIMRIRPKEDYLYSALYRVTVSSKVADNSQNPLGLNYSWAFSTMPDIPRVKEILPRDKTTMVPTATQIMVELTQALDPERVRQGIILLRDPEGAIIPGSLRYVHDEKRLIYAPDYLFNETIYTIEVTNLGEDAFGRQLEPAFSSFRTLDIVPPRIIRTLPSDGEKGVPHNVKVIVQFNEIIDTRTLNDRTVIFTDGDAIVPGAMGFNQGTNTLTYNPDSPLIIGKGYRMTLTTDILDMDGNNMPSVYTFGFYTMPYDPDEIALRMANYSAADEAAALSAAQRIMGKGFYEHLIPEERVVESIIADDIPPEVFDIYPVDNQDNVPTTTQIAVIFSEPVQEDTLISPQNIFVEEGKNRMGGHISYDRETRRLLFKPEEELQPEKQYKANIRGGIRDLFGNPLLEKAWFFKTGKTGYERIVAVAPEKKAEPVFTLEDLEIDDVEDYLDPGPQPFIGTREILYLGEGDIYSAPTIKTSRNQWAFKLVEELSRRFDRQGPIKTHSKVMVASRHELALILKRILAKMERGWLNYLYKSKEGIKTLVLIQQAMVEFEQELTMVGVNLDFFEKRFEAAGLPVQKIRSDMEMGIIKGIESRTTMAEISPTILLKMRKEVEEIGLTLDNARIRMIRIPERNFPEKAIYMGKLSRGARLCSTVMDGFKTSGQFDKLRTSIQELHDILNSIRGYLDTLEPGPIAGELSFLPAHLTQSESRLVKVENTIEYYSGKLFEDLSLYSDRLGEAEGLARQMLSTLASTDQKIVDKLGHSIYRRMKEVAERLKSTRMKLPEETGQIFNDRLSREYLRELANINSIFSQISGDINGMVQGPLKERLGSYPAKIDILLGSLDNLESKIRVRGQVAGKKLGEGGIF